MLHKSREKLYNKISMNKYNVQIIWDDEGNQYIAESDDIDGLVFGSNSLDVLIDRVKFVASDLLNSKEFSLNFSFSTDVTSRFLGD